MEEGFKSYMRVELAGVNSEGMGHLIGGRMLS